MFPERDVGKDGTWSHIYRDGTNTAFHGIKCRFKNLLSSHDDLRKNRIQEGIVLLLFMGAPPKKSSSSTDYSMISDALTPFFSPSLDGKKSVPIKKAKTVPPHEGRNWIGGLL